jgi:hypothetical protein
MSSDMTIDADGAASRGPIPKSMDRDVSAAELSGRWVNDLGTVIDLRSHADGRVSGTVKFGATGASYQLYPLKGTCVLRPDGQRGIVGTVPGWPQPSSLTVWCGELDTDGSVLSTKLLSAAGESSHQALDGGTDFHRTQAASRRRSA